ncbi:type II secretion system protein M [Acinetobacter pittii]|jgi:general secretion pathway protein M|uniref:type II secretion system protein GspM n=1 Tax=Acinetobacter TaxID=469 RepID=UPI00044B45D5|nr:MULTISPECIES: type II secretion system protein GspM [Acinetobacter calcoaceticus/baumannii complex]EXC29112.1 type II secretion system (T2SS), M family protein [Acinetobacter sp. 809848]MCE6001801.1 type II secretion system protein M [Acinetobacter pittii]MCE6628793.1 type II secretion system protein M [Acinetobacter pittii]MCU4442751.1 type II secretion system protein M [Acinetobacter pittii]MDP7847767.1 type II secretion system protein GspM [Acinetobacter pittii]
MKMLAQVQNRFDQWIEQVNQYLDRLTVRERIMVVFTTIFVVVAIIGASLWKMHSLAEQQQQRLNDLKDLMVWMQSNAVTMKPASELELGQAEKIQRVAQQQGLTVTSQQNGEQLQIIVTHQNYAILANFLTQLAQMGLSIEKMEMISSEGQIKLTATVQ